MASHQQPMANQNKDLFYSLFKALCVVIALYLFLVGINGMSSAIKHMGSEVADFIFTTTSNTIIALFIGVFSTVLFQSSSTTTSLIVGLVSSGTLSLSGAVPMIMGANIGTTVTSLLASMVSGTIAPLAVALSHLTFNLLGIGLLYPIKSVREIPIRLAEKFSDLATKNKIYPLLYILIVFFLIPLALISLVR